MVDLTVVIPVWNEAGRVASGIAGFSKLWGMLPRGAWSTVECLVVDDGSTDGTGRIAEAAAGPGVRVLTAPHRGKGAAIRRGVVESRGRRILVVDVDWSVAPGQVAELLRVQGQVVCASREGHGARRIGEPAWRHLLGRGFNRVVQQFVLAGVQDSQCGCKAFDHEVAMDLFGRLTIEGWAFDVELLTMAYAHGYSVREVPIVWRHDADSRVGVLTDGWAMFRDVRKVRRNLRAGVYFNK